MNRLDTGVLLPSKPLEAMSYDHRRFSPSMIAGPKMDPSHVQMDAALCSGNLGPRPQDDRWCFDVCLQLAEEKKMEHRCDDRD